MSSPSATTAFASGLTYIDLFELLIVYCADRLAVVGIEVFVYRLYDLEFLQIRQAEKSAKNNGGIIGHNCSLQFW
jgi:hypothetical protein